jgi:hypothetical protein
MSVDHGFALIPEAEKSRNLLHRGRLVNTERTMPTVTSGSTGTFTAAVPPAGSRPVFGGEVNVAYNCPAFRCARSKALRPADGGHARRPRPGVSESDRDLFSE